MDKIQQGATSAVIINQNNEILFLLRSGDDDFLPGIWDVPGGGMDYGETPIDGLKREIREECNLDVDIIKILTASTYFMGKKQRIDITYLCRVIEPAHLELSSEHTDFKWLKLQNIGELNLNKYIENIVLSAKEDLS